MHHAPAGPPLSTRLAAALAGSRSRLSAGLAVLRPCLRLLRRTRLVPVLVAGLVIGFLALAAPVPAVERTPSDTAALTAPSGTGRELVPASGDGWTEDGAPPAPDSAAAEDVPASAPADGAAPEVRAAPEAAEVPADTAPSSVADAPVRPATAPETSSAEASPDAAPAPSAGPGSTAPTTNREPSPSSPSRSSSSPASSPASTPASSSSPSSSSAAPSSPSAPPSSSAGAGSAAVDQVLADVNAERAASGCEPLTVDAGLAGAAAAHSAAMRDQETLLPPPGKGAVAGGLDDPAAVAAGWLADAAVPSTACALTTAGIGVADGWWTLLLA